MSSLSAAAAAKFLDEAAGSGPGELRDLVLRHLAVMQGIGWALMAVHDQLAASLAPGTVVLSSAEADTAWQAVADAAAWRAGRAGDGGGDGSRDEMIAADYAALRSRLGGDRR